MSLDSDVDSRTTELSSAAGKCLGLTTSHFLHGFLITPEGQKSTKHFHSQANYQG